jgi:hypothetical protein
MMTTMEARMRPRLMDHWRVVTMRPRMEGAASSEMYTTAAPKSPAKERPWEV